MTYPKQQFVQPQTKKFYNIKNPEDKERVKQFEKSFLNWLEKNPKYKDDAFSLFRWYEYLKVIKIKNDDVINFIITDPKMYFSLERKWGALQVLRVKRGQAKEYNEPPTEEIQVAEIPF